MSKVTATIKSATARAIFVKLTGEKKCIQDEAKNVTFVSAFDDIVSLYGDYQTAKFFNETLIKKYKGSKEVVYVGMVENSFIPFEQKYEMEESTFIENAKILAPEDSRLGLITRNIKSYMVTYTAVTKDKQFVTDSAYVSTNLEKRMKKEVEDDAKEKGYMVVFSMEVPTETESLYGMDKDKFVTLGKAVQ